MAAGGDHATSPLHHLLAQAGSSVPPDPTSPMYTKRIRQTDATAHKRRQTCVLLQSRNNFFISCLTEGLQIVEAEAHERGGVSSSVLRLEAQRDQPLEQQAVASARRRAMPVRPSGRVEHVWVNDGCCRRRSFTPCDQSAPCAGLWMQVLVGGTRLHARLCLTLRQGFVSNPPGEIFQVPGLLALWTYFRCGSSTRRRNYFFFSIFGQTSRLNVFYE